jgi:hypothetical protein
MSYALVEDIPASWERYQVIARSLGRAPRGLLVHVAGPTDEGFRIIEVWESEADWLAFSSQLEAALDSVEVVAIRTTVRDLRAVHVVIGDAWPGHPGNDWATFGPNEIEVALEGPGKERDR